MNDSGDSPHWDGVGPPPTGHAHAKHPPHPTIIQVMGPGLITGASDDDPSGIATYSQAGAQFGYGLGWTLLFTYPLMCAIQEISARIGRVTGRGLAGNLRRHYPAVAAAIARVALLLVANTINLGADLGAMGAALRSADRRPDPRLCRRLSRVADGAAGSLRRAIRATSPC